MVNQRFVDLFFPNDDPVGRVIWLSDAKTDPTAAPWLTIVGVAPTIRQNVARGTRPVYTSRWPRTGRARIDHRWSPLRSDGNGPSTSPRVAAADPHVILFNVRPLSDLLDDSRLQPRLIGTVIAVFAGIALLLSVVGLYAFTAYAVQQRTHEIGVRMALGAQPSQVVRLFVKRGLLPLGTVLTIGLVGAFAVGRLLQGLLIHTSPTDPVTLVFITLLLVVVSVAACFLPARKAAHLDPLAVLRYD